MILIGVDVGGTKTTALAVDLQGRVLARAHAGAGNWEGIGLAAAAQLYATIISDLLSHANALPDDVGAVAWGLAGLDWPSDEARLRPLLAPLTPRATVITVNDAFLPLRAGSHDPFGVGVIAGTGSTVAGMAVDGRRYRTFGLGSDWADFAGAQSLTIAAMSMAAEAHYGRRAPTLLTALLCDWGGVPDIPTLAEGLSRGTIERDPATFAPQVTQAAAAGDAAAMTIVDTAAQLLADNAGTVARQLDLTGQPHTVVIAGGAAAALFVAFTQALRHVSPSATPVLLGCEPVVGAVLLACDAVQPRAAALVRRALTNEE